MRHPSTVSSPPPPAGHDPTSAPPSHTPQDHTPSPVRILKHLLISEGWTPVTPTDPWTDIEAVRAGQRLIGEAKGKTSEPDTDTDADADIAYGQLLRRMTSDTPDTRYALIVPTTSVTAARGVPAHIRERLRIDLYEVTRDDEVRPIL